MRLPGAMVLAVLLFSATPPAGAGPLVHDPCPDAAVLQPFAANPMNLENLHFHRGALYVTGGDARLHRFAPDGSDTVVADLGQRSGAMVTGADGALYVRVGSDPGEVWRFPDPGASGAHTVAATGLAGANGMAVDAAGNIYVSSEAGDVIYKLPAGDPASWSVWAEVYGPNGLAIDDAAGVLYVAQTTDGRSPIAVIDLATAEVGTLGAYSFGFAQLDLFDPVPLARVVPPSDPSSPALPKGMDDLTLGPDGQLYATAWVTGEVLRIDPSGARPACAVATGLEQPSSVRVARGFGAWDGALFVTDFGGPAQLVVDTPQDAHVSVIPLRLG